MLTLSQIFIYFRCAIYLYWAMAAALLGYWAVYFEGEKDFAAAKIGLMMSMYVGAALIGQYFFGFLCDRLQSIRVPVSLAAILYSLLVAVIPLLSDMFWIYPCMALVGFFQQPIGPMLDSWTLKHLSQHDQRTLFGKIRGFGSLGWASVALLTAYLIFYVSWNMMFVVSVLAGVLLSGLVLLIPDVVETNSSDTTDRSDLTMSRALSHLFGNQAYLYILAVVFLMYLGVQTTFNFQGLLIKGTGGGVKELGWTFFFGVMSEMPAMFLSVWLLPNWTVPYCSRRRKVFCSKI